MDSSYFTQNREFLSINGLNCIRNDYFYNNCQKCVEICPTNALNIERNKLILDNKLCTECAICIGGCPSEAISSEAFSENNFTINANSSKLSCRDNTPCLAIFDQHHLISLAILRDEDIELNLSYCNDCEFNKDSKVSTVIKNRIKSSNNFLDNIGLNKKIATKDEIEVNSRRGLFKSLHSFTKKIVENDNSLNSLELRNDFEKRVPIKKIVLKNSLKTVISDIKTKLENSDFLFSQKIDYEKCTNCQECIEFCPTNALFANQIQDSIFIQSGKCIGCEICHNICKEQAIMTNNNIDLVSFAFDKAELLTKFEIASCSECKLSFPYKGGKVVCNRCTNFTEEFEDIFKLAKDF